MLEIPTPEELIEISGEKREDLKKEFRKSVTEQILSKFPYKQGGLIKIEIPKKFEKVYDKYLPEIEKLLEERGWEIFKVHPGPPAKIGGPYFVLRPSI